MARSLDLAAKYDDPRHVVVTAHRGWAARYPENTMPAFQEAAALGVDLLAVDIRGTRDHVPICLHDATLDRTTNATGSPNEYDLAELRCFNASHWRGTDREGYRDARPAQPRLPIPTLHELLAKLAHAAGFNLHVHETEPALLAAIHRLFDDYDLYAQAYLTLNTYRQAQQVRMVNPRIPLCVLEHQGRYTRATLQQTRDFGCRAVQLLPQDLTPEVCAAIADLRLWPNVYTCQTPADTLRHLRSGIRGLITAHPDLILQTIRKLGLT